MSLETTLDKLLTDFEDAPQEVAAADDDGRGN